MSNLKQLDIRRTNDECQNDLNVKQFDHRHLNIECQTV